jgi:hypothetical protein
MTPEDFKEIIEAALAQSTGMDYTQIGLLVLISGAGAFFGAYLKEKAKSVVTKEDITEITTKVENVKRSIDAIKNSENTKYELKYKACIESLRLIDAHLSHTLSDPNGVEITKQTASTEEARACHNNLILSCESKCLIDMFNSIMFDSSSETPPTDQLNNFRNLIRKELGFGEELSLDRDNAWFGKIGFNSDS